MDFPAALPLVAGVAALWLAACTAVPPSPPPAALPAPPQTLGVPSGYTLVWSDEFSSDGLPDPSRWTYDTGMNKTGWHNRELQYYSATRAENAELRGGRLVIQARRESMSQAPDWGGQRYTSSRLLTKGLAEWTYGFFEVRAKLPCGKGSWPAIWMLNSALDWPKGGELDIMEHVGREPDRIFSTVHTAAANGAGKGGGTRVRDVCDAFHDYQMHWTPRVALRHRRQAAFRPSQPGSGRTSRLFDTPQFLILNIAVGGDLGGPVDDTLFPMRWKSTTCACTSRRGSRSRGHNPACWGPQASTCTS